MEASNIFTNETLMSFWDRLDLSLKNNLGSRAKRENNGLILS